MPRLAPFVFAALALPAHADLYRWVDPETGSIKFSNSPPAWMGEGERRNEPEVRLIPSRPVAPSASSTPAVLEKPAAAPGKPAAAPAVAAPQRAEEAGAFDRLRKALQK
jgi:hypothetical protein